MSNVSIADDGQRADLLRPALVLAALGVVFGDIGTSPLYAFRESLRAAGGVSHDTVLGLLSLIFWAITLVVSIKYVSLVLLADNDGEGGILALLAGVLRQVPRDSRFRHAAILAGLAGAAMFYGDSVITPAISVLSAVEGLEVVSPQFKSLVIPLTLAILVALFSAQRLGTASMGRWFGPVMLLWFGSLALLGLLHIARNPQVLQALVPLHAIAFAVENPQLLLAVLGAVFLAVTGGEALYADLGHFGRRPIRLAWFWIVMPALALNYFGQGALVLADPKAVENPFFLLAPELLQLPLVVLAAAATVIASQAVISGAFSLTAQAVRLGYIPRMDVRFTSKTSAGQIYVPLINWALLAVVIALVLAFGSSSELAAAYGIAVSTTMVITTLGAMLIAARRWGWTPGRAWLVCGPLLLLDVAFTIANLTKVNDGGWFPLAFGGVLMLVFVTWMRGRELLGAALTRTGLQMQPFLHSLSTYPPQRVDGTAVFMTPTVDMIPHSLLHNLKHNRVLHERVLFLTAESDHAPHVAPEAMVQLRDLGDGCWYARVRLGFQDAHEIDAIARNLGRYHDFDLVPAETSFFLSRQTVLVSNGKGMAPWRKRMFGWLMRNAQPASDFFHIPPNRVIEIGTQVTL
ncbi:MAG: potassium transporter Kup [Burkholderiales bacterium]|nr:potassium transporter Kup [Burkholderiales bacterium]